ncbi:Olfactory receptor 9 [Camelus dromedarius]|uniref:Olfactory receptor 9 n=1 Tax=Camelus dromedarius TaxID=9838 RepID=A0A5N4DFW1_CAMDR|nr:Olfactory receptor 9 [Camelus dromedarius]
MYRCRLPSGPSVLGGALRLPVTLLGNLLIILLTLADAALRSPLYFFLRHFSVVEILCTTTICFTQLRFFALFGVAERCLLTAMARGR